MGKYSEKLLCEKFMEYAKSMGYKVFPELDGWDIVVQHPNGIVIGIQAKLRLNPRVVAQVLERKDDVDFRSVLVNGNKQDRNLLSICYHAKIVVLHYNFDADVFTLELNRDNIFHYRHRPSVEINLDDLGGYVAEAGIASPRTFSKRKILLVKLEMIADTKDGLVSYYDAQKMGLKFLPKTYFKYDSETLLYKLIKRPSDEWPHIKDAILNAKDK